MVLAWYHCDNGDNKNLPHQSSPPDLVDLEKLKYKTGMKYLKIKAEDLDSNDELQMLKKKHGCIYSDQVIIDNSEESQKHHEKYYTEHLHEDDEIRMVLEGSGYFDVRDNDTDHWIRVFVEKDDLLIVPSGIYHRFTLDTKAHIRLLRLFTETPKWTAYNRPADNHPARLKYIQNMKSA